MLFYKCEIGAVAQDGYRNRHHWINIKSLFTEKQLSLSKETIMLLLDAHEHTLTPKYIVILSSVQ